MSFEGLLLVDKPRGMTSHDVVDSVRRAFHTRRVGHAGTLDPLATGLLIIMVGRATRLSDYLLNGDKAYEVGVELGRQTDTLDDDGRTVKTHEGPMPSQETIVETILSLKGRVELEVPQYSAVKVKGKKLYEYAREGQVLEPVRREMEFHKVDLLDLKKDGFSVRISCSKGGYIRSWANEIGQRLGCGAVVTSLRRVLAYPYKIEEASPLEEIMMASDTLPRGAIPMERVLDNMTAVQVPVPDVQIMLSGRIPVEVLRKSSQISTPLVRVLGPSGDLLAILEQEQQGHLTIGCVLGPLSS